jgi:hypothetical protein
MPGFFLSARFVDRVVVALHAGDEERADAMRAIGRRSCRRIRSSARVCRSMREHKGKCPATL